MSSILIRRANMVSGGVTPRLPAGYTELLYLESTGTQYIDMSCDVDKALFFGIEADIWALHPNDNKYGIFSANPYQQFRSEFYSYNSSTGYSIFTSTIGNLSAVGGAGGGWVAEIGGKTHIVLSTEGITTNGVYRALTRPLTANITNFRLFGSYKNYGRYPIRIGEFKITGGTTLMRDLIPAMRDSDSVVGMYDLANNTFLTNAGSGTFSYGTL